MKKFLTMLIAFLSITSIPSVFCCNGWANRLEAMLHNNNGYCSDLSTEEEREACYAFKQEYAQFWDAAVTKIEEHPLESTEDSQIFSLKGAYPC